MLASLPEAPAVGHSIDYTIHSPDAKNPHRRIEVHATPEELRRFEADGFLVRERLFSGEALEHLRAALDEVVEAEAKKDGFAVGTSRRFGGVFIRQLMDRHAAFHTFLDCAPMISVARAMLGPQVWIRDTVARVTYPGQPNQETEWHFHQRVVPSPLPPWFSFPHIVDALVYLDDLSDATGPICVVPGSHKRIESDLPDDDFADKPDQVALRVPAGSVVFIHGNLWHRAMPTLPHGARRRLVIAGFAPTWMKAPPHGRIAEDGLIARKIKAGGDETRELLGAQGYY
ncbi:MAG: phytanoyl-CoA dioxygenase family protein [Planctomycetes bacterium]|nr:phytanoyl-CoA dioxygenase family protein [Planctomycetota bacterium]